MSLWLGNIFDKARKWHKFDDPTTYILVFDSPKDSVWFWARKGSKLQKQHNVLIIIKKTRSTYNCHGVNIAKNKEIVFCIFLFTGRQKIVTYFFSIFNVVKMFLILNKKDKLCCKSHFNDVTYTLCHQDSVTVIFNSGGLHLKS